MNEHELFEESYENLFGEFPKCVFFDDGCYKLIRSAEGVDIFNSTKMMINASWLMWCSSANRDGYKLVPVEADDNMEHAGHCALINGGTVHKIYKAMIGAVDES